MKILYMVLFITLLCFSFGHADLGNQLTTLQQSLSKLKTKLNELHQSLNNLKNRFNDLIPQRTFGEIAQNWGSAQQLILEEPKLLSDGITLYDINVLPQHFKTTVKDYAQVGLWLSTIDPQFARDGWLCGFHAIKNALYLCKILTIPQETFDAQKEKLIQNFQGAKTFLKYLEWPKAFSQQPTKFEIPSNVIQLGRDAVLQHLSQHPPWQPLIGSLPWGMSWLQNRVLQNLPEAERTQEDADMQYTAKPKPALYSIMYNPIDLPEDLMHLKESMSVGKTVASKFMKQCLQKTIIIRKFYPEDSSQQKFLPEDETALINLSKKFNSLENLIVPILWSYETTLGNHWVTLIVVKRGNAKEILLADPNIPHYWINQNEAIINELALVLKP